jgi:guanylate kinase
MTKAKAKKTTKKKTKGVTFVVSAPSGAGKSTLCSRLTSKMPNLKLSVSYTTRPPRKGEIQDVHYSFVSEKKFMNLIAKGEFAEWAMVHGNLYGTSLKRIRKLNRDGYDIIFDVDVRGAKQLRGTCHDAVYIFILPPSLTTLRKRLKDRSTDSSETIAQRMKNARVEIGHYAEYDYIVVNDNIDQALKDLESIMNSTKLRTEQADHTWIKNSIK